jgi:hypothetical protein
MLVRKTVAEYPVIGRDAERLFQPLAALDARVAGIAFGLDRGLSLFRDDHLDHMGHVVFSFGW